MLANRSLSWLAFAMHLNASSLDSGDWKLILTRYVRSRRADHSEANALEAVRSTVLGGRLSGTDSLLNKSRAVITIYTDFIEAKKSQVLVAGHRRQKRTIFIQLVALGCRILVL